MKLAVATLLLAFAAQAHSQAPSPAQKMAATVIQEWPAGVISTVGKPGTWAYEEGVLLDGMAAEWHQTADGADYNYIKAAVDKYIDQDGTIKGYNAADHNLDNIEMGRAVLLVYRVTLQEKYAKAARFLHEQLAVQPRTPSGGYWHKQIYPNQMWLDGAYMAEPFRAEYAYTFQTREDYDDIAKQLLLMDAHMRDAKTGLLRHGWDESKQMEWADKTTGLSPEVWGRAVGWYAMALVDTLDWFPQDHPQRPALLKALTNLMEAVSRVQDPRTGLWWQVLDRGDQKGNFPEASVSAMFTYAIAKSMRLGYIPQHFDPFVQRAWPGILRTFVKTGPDGSVTFTGTVKVGGLGGKPYRSGSYDYYIGEPTGDNDAKGIGAFLLAGSEMEQSATERLGQGKLVTMDGWFNSQVRPYAEGKPVLFHYKWDNDDNNGFSFLGHAFQSYGAKLNVLSVAPTSENLAKSSVYLIVSPDIPIKNPTPHSMDDASGDAIEAWVKDGGVLILMMNDVHNTEFERMNTLGERFGIHFNPVDRNLVPGDEWDKGMLKIPATPGLFPKPLTVYMKEICTIKTSGPAKPVYVDKGDTIIAMAKVGKGSVFAVTDPWLYNEYTDGRKLPPLYQDFQAAEDLAGWAIRSAK